MAAHFGTLPVLKNQRWERFAQELVKGKSATEAYEAAGYKGDRRCASHLATKSDILRRVEELQREIAERVVEKTSITRAEILNELAKVAFANVNMAEVKVSDKRAACVNYAEIECWKIERHEHGPAGEFAHIDAMTPDERRVLRQSFYSDLWLPEYLRGVILSGEKQGANIDGT